MEEEGDNMSMKEQDILKEFCSIVEDCIDRHRHVLERCFVDGKSYAEVAEEMGLSRQRVTFMAKTFRGCVEGRMKAGERGAVALRLIGGDPLPCRDKLTQGAIAHLFRQWTKETKINMKRLGRGLGEYIAQVRGKDGDSKLGDALDFLSDYLGADQPDVAIALAGCNTVFSKGGIRSDCLKKGAPAKTISMSPAKLMRRIFETAYHQEKAESLHRDEAVRRYLAASELEPVKDPKALDPKALHRIRSLLTSATNRFHIIYVGGGRYALSEAILDKYGQLVDRAADLVENWMKGEGAGCADIRELLEEVPGVSRIAEGDPYTLKALLLASGRFLPDRKIGVSLVGGNGKSCRIRKYNDILMDYARLHGCPVSVEELQAAVQEERGADIPRSSIVGTLINYGWDSPSPGYFCHPDIKSKEDFPEEAERAIENFMERHPHGVYMPALLDFPALSRLGKVEAEKLIRKRGYLIRHDPLFPIVLPEGKNFDEVLGELARGKCRSDKDDCWRELCSIFSIPEEKCPRFAQRAMQRLRTST
jgi:hypothetical protein